MSDLQERLARAMHGELSREPREHQIKCWPEPFQAMLEGRKTAEFRLNDRDYRIGDVLWIREWCPEAEAYTDRSLTRQISHVLSAGFGLPDGYAMLSLDPDVARLTAVAAKETGDE